MKTIYKFVMLLAFSLSISIASGQDVIETPKPDFSTEHRDVIKRVFSFRDDGLDAEQLSNATGTLEEILKQSDNKYARYITTFHLTFFYAQAKEYEKCLNLLESGQKEGFFFPVITGNFTWPEYLPELKKLERFDNWLGENKRRQEQAQKNATSEYFVQTPVGYTKDKTYPLLIIFHGGIDSNISSYINWQSPRLKSECIVAYIQGSRIQGSFHRSMSANQQTVAKQAYQQIIQKYTVDPNRVIVGGASAGGMIAATIAQDATIPVTGAILAFPGPPPGLTEAKLRQAAERGLRVALLTGELDGAIKIQKELGVLFDKAGLPNRFVVFPGIGHQFPEDFSNQIDISLDYIWEGSQKEATPNTPKGVKITYVGNEGFLIQSKNRKVLIDALFKSNSAFYLSPTEAMINQMIQGEPPYDKVDLLLVTHRHSDHFKPDLTIAFLQNNQACKLIANNQVVDELRNQQSYENIQSQIVEIDSDTGSHSCFSENDIEIDAFCLKHSPYMRGGKNIHAEIKNLAFIVNLEGTRFYHSGDATIQENITVLKDYEYSQKPVDVTFLQRYDTSSASKQFITKTIKPDMIIAMHIEPDKIDQTEEEFTTHYPYGIIFREQGQTEHFTKNVNHHTLFRPYFGQEPPGDIPRLFAPERINHLAHSSPTFSPDGTEIMWSTVSDNEGTRKIYRVTYQNGRWSAPTIATFSGRYHDDQPFISYDGLKLFFASKRPKTPGGEENLDLWYCTKTENGWSEPTLVNDSIGMWTPSVTRSGTLYFIDIIGDAQAMGYQENAVGIFRSVLIDGTYATPELLPENINTKEFHDWTPFIAPNESYLIFSSHREGGYGSGDLYISFRDKNGNWGEPINMGPAINTDKQERFPGVSPDGKYLFFTRWCGPPHYHDLYWVSVDAVPALHSMNNPSPEN